MSSKNSGANQVNLSPNTKFQYRLVNNRVNPGLLFLNRQSIFNHILTSRQNKNDNFCLYLHRFCLQNRLEGYNYCIRHILYDRNAPFKQCSYTHPQTSKRCPNAARRFDRRDITYCPWHIKKFNLLNKKRNTLPESSGNVSQEVFKRENLKRKIEELEHYCPSNEHDHRRKNVDWEQPDDKCITASKTLREKINESANNIQSQSQSDDDFANITLAEVLNLDLVDSDNEGTESYMDDPLRHAGAYTAEEIARILRDKMLRLQTLYINLLNYYRYILKNKMHEYYLNLKNEKSISQDDDPSTSEIPVDFLKEQEDNEILKAMKKYHNIWGVEKVYRDTSSDIRRLLIEDSEPKPQTSEQVCIYAKDSEICTQPTIPLSQYCKNHILYDPHQILYRPCAGGSPPCLTPIISYVHKNSCVRHVQIKFDKSEIDNIMKCSLKTGCNDNNALAELDNEPDPLFQSMEDISLGMEPVVPENLFGLEQFDLDNPDML